MNEKAIDEKQHEIGDLPTQPMPTAMPTERPIRAGGSAPPPVDVRTAASGANQGEGDRIAARRYDEAVRAHVASGASEPAARAALAEVEGPEAERLRAAEAAGRRPARVSWFDRALGLIRRVLSGSGD